MSSSSNSGWLLLDKPVNLSSSQVLGPLRRIYRKVGHAGTLDPFASGLLIVAINNATALIDDVMGQDKQYVFTVHWGERRDTDDITGKVIEVAKQLPTPEDIEGVLPEFLGQVAQVPPQYSAISVRGERAYSLARKDLNFSLLPRLVTIKELQVVKHCLHIDQKVVDSSTFTSRVGKGCYVRAIARDLAARLGTCGYVSTLRRQAIGDCSVDQAITYNNLLDMVKSSIQSGEEAAISMERVLLPIHSLLRDIAVREIGDSGATELCHGRKASLTYDVADDSRVLVTREGVEVAVCTYVHGVLTPKRVFNTQNL